MTRPILVLGATVLAATLGSGIWWATRRDPGVPPQEESQEPFHAGPAGAGQLIEFQPPPAPLRSLRWTAPLPGGAAVAQILTQTGRQQVVLFLQGEPGPTVTLPEPADAQGTFFQFADLVDAALAPDDALVLLYRSGEEAAPALVLAWDLRTQQLRWSHRAPGDHLAMSPDRRSVFLFGAQGPISILDLAKRTGSLKPTSAQVDLPLEVKGVSSLLPTGPRAFLVAHVSGLSAWRNGTWAHVQAPPPSPLGFTAGLGRLAGTAKAGWWQPGPGILIPLGPDGKPGDAQALKGLLPEPASMDADLLQLLGEETDGHLWFGLARPALPAPPPIPTPAMIQNPDTPDANPPEAPPAPPPAAIQPSREIWETYINRGLERLYRWKPGESRMKAVSLAEAWKSLVPPPGIPCPAGTGGLRPEAGAILSGGPERVWWLPLKSLQPR